MGPAMDTLDELLAQGGAEGSFDFAFVGRPFSQMIITMKMYIYAHMNMNTNIAPEPQPLLFDIQTGMRRCRQTWRTERTMSGC